MKQKKQKHILTCPNCKEQFDFTEYIETEQKEFLDKLVKGIRKD